jgi:hypothetical protein
VDGLSIPASENLHKSSPAGHARARPVHPNKRPCRAAAVVAEMANNCHQPLSVDRFPRAPDRDRLGHKSL